MTFEPGEPVAVLCDVQEGAFPGEYLVTVPTVSGPVSGFVREDDMAEPRKALLGTVRSATKDVVSVLLRGSFFNTNGLADFRADWARTNVRSLAAV